MTEAVIQISRLTKIFGGGRRFLKPQAHVVRALTEVSVQVKKGETLAIVGESGSGKSTLARILVGLETPTSGTVTIAGRDAAALRAQGPAAFGKTIQYVFQDPIASLNPRHTIRQILDAPLRILAGLAPAQRAERMRALMADVDMPEETLDRYPHEMSGGQAQRMAIARALAAEPDILVLDEPVSALDVSVQAQVLILLQRLKERLELSYLFISHDLAVVEAIADRGAVMHSGEIVELEETRQLFRSPIHPYTQKLIRSAPRIGR